MQPYEVEKTRTRKVPVKEYKEVQGFETIRVPQEKVIMADSFRVDEVEETKIVEVEELQVPFLNVRCQRSHVSLSTATFCCVLHFCIHLHPPPHPLGPPPSGSTYTLALLTLIGPHPPSTETPKVPRMLLGVL